MEKGLQCTVPKTNPQNLVPYDYTQSIRLQFNHTTFFVTTPFKHIKTIDMRNIIIGLLLISVSSAFGQTKDTKNTNPNFDKTLADKLGADDYGMKSYFLVILKTGTNTSTDKELVNQSFRVHLENINKLVKDEKLIVAGPLGKNEKNYRGIFILNNLKTIAEAKELLITDPAIKNKFLDYDIISWYGSAALSEYLPFSDKIWRMKP